MFVKAIYEACRRTTGENKRRVLVAQNKKEQCTTRQSNADLKHADADSKCTENQQNFDQCDADMKASVEDHNKCSAELERVKPLLQKQIEARDGAMTLQCSKRSKLETLTADCMKASTAKEVVEGLLNAAKQTHGQRHAESERLTGLYESEAVKHMNSSKAHEEVKARIEGIREKITVTERDIGMAESSIQNTNREITAGQADVMRQQKLISDAGKNLSALNNDKKNQLVAKTKAEQDRRNIDRELNKTKKALAAAEGKLKLKITALENDEKALKSTQLEMDNLRVQIDKVTADKVAIVHTIDGVQKSIAKAEEDMRTKSSTLNGFIESISKLSAEKSVLDSKMRTLTETRDSLKTQMSELEENIKRSASQLNEARGEIDAQYHKMSSIEEAVQISQLKLEKHKLKFEGKIGALSKQVELKSQVEQLKGRVESEYERARKRLRNKN